MPRLEKVDFLNKEVLRTYLKSGTKIYSGDSYWHSYDGRIVICYRVKDNGTVGYEDIRSALEIIYELDDTMVDLD